MSHDHNHGHDHDQADTGEEFTCDCGETFETKAELKAHAREEHDADV